jgi:hypothetical protein
MPSKKPAPTPESSRGPVLAVVILAVVVVAGLTFLLRSPDAPASEAAVKPTTAAVPGAARQAAAPPPVVSADQRPAPSAPRASEPDPVPTRGPLPPLPFADFAPPRPVEVVHAVYEFAARHPEVMRYVPCFCGCERNGHQDNEDCFVKSRDSRGNVTWDVHGMG